MAIVRRSEIRKALKDRMGQFQLQRGHLENRLGNLTALKLVPLPALLGEPATERMLDNLMDELQKKLGAGTNTVLLD